MTENKTIQQLKTEQAQPPKKEVEKSISEKFIEELDEKEKEIFLKIKNTRIEICEYEEFEAVTEESLDDYVQLITYIKQGKILFDDDGVIIKVRREIKSEKGDFLTNEIKLLFVRNEARERAFTKKIKIKKDDNAAQIDYTRAAMAANLANVNVNGTSVILTSRSISKMHKNDYSLLMTCFEFFRN